MKKYCVFLVVALGVYGCAEIQKKPVVLSYSEIQARNLGKAKWLLQENKFSAATDVLNVITSSKGVPGVTDEALFRQALLCLDSGQGKNDIGQAQELLEKLIREYPRSTWKNHSASIIEFITTLNRRIKSLKGENLSLKEEKLSLAKENRELRLNIEKLKTLDVEQDMKVKR